MQNGDVTHKMPKAMLNLAQSEDCTDPVQAFLQFKYRSMQVIRDHYSMKRVAVFSPQPAG